MKIKETEDYSIFKLLTDINRPLNGKQINVLMNSIQKLGCLRPIVVAELNLDGYAKGLYIIDGQHLYYALIALRTSIPYVTITLPSNDIAAVIEAIALFNSSSKRWNMEDYVRAWRMKNESYNKLYLAKKGHFISYDSLAFLSTNNITSRNKAEKLLRKGEIYISFSLEQISRYCRIAHNLANSIDVIHPTLRRIVYQELFRYIMKHNPKVDFDSVFDKCEKFKLPSQLDEKNLKIALNSKLFNK